MSRSPVLPRHRVATARRRSRALQRELDVVPHDAVISIASSTDVVALRDRPIIQVTDATFDAVLDFYPMFTGLSKGSRQQGRRVEREAASRTHHFLVASDWARESLTRDVGVAPDRITVAPFGPAIAPRSARPAHDPDRIEILFVSSNWERKNGQLVLEAAHHLERDARVHITIAGDAPRIELSNISVIGRVPPQELSELYLRSDLLLEPTRANAAGVVITDALHHGLPVFATNVGGVPTIVRDGITGVLIDRNATGDDIAHIVRSVDHATLTSMARAAAVDASTRLSWGAWARSFGRIPL